MHSSFSFPGTPYRRVPSQKTSGPVPLYNKYALLKISRGRPRMALYGPPTYLRLRPFLALLVFSNEKACLRDRKRLGPPMATMAVALDRNLFFAYYSS